MRGEKTVCPAQQLGLERQVTKGELGWRCANLKEMGVCRVVLQKETQCSKNRLKHTVDRENRKFKKPVCLLFSHEAETGSQPVPTQSSGRTLRLPSILIGCRSGALELQTASGFKANGSRRTVRQHQFKQVESQDVLQVKSRHTVLWCRDPRPQGTKAVWLLPLWN